MNNKQQPEIRAKVYEEQWGGFTADYIHHFENQDSLDKFIDETGYRVEVLSTYPPTPEEAEYTVSSPSAPWLSEVTVKSLVQAVQIKRGWLRNQGAQATIKDQDGFLISTQEQMDALLDELEN